MQLASGENVYGTHVICNASTWDVSSLLPEPWKSHVDAQTATMDQCASFMHINATVPKSALPSHAVDSPLPNYVVVRDFAQPLDAPGNVTLVSVPSVVDTSVCRPGYVVAHAYLPATKPLVLWAALETVLAEYVACKRERAKPLWDALARVLQIDEVEGVAETAMVSTPRMHTRFLHSPFGSYGHKGDGRGRGAGIGIPFPWEVDMPGGMHCVGDGVFPGIGCQPWRRARGSWSRAS